MLSADVSDMFTESDAARPQGIGHLLIALDPARFGAEANGRLDHLASAVIDGGGRLPGAGRQLQSEVDDEEPLDIAETVITELADWAKRLGITMETTTTA